MAASIPMVGMTATAVTVAEAAVGFFGKIPSRGDFVRAGLPRAFTDPWDDWLSHAIAGSRDLLGATWLPAWMEAPIWHFTLPPGQCGIAAVLGLWMPSIDAAGRYFPLTLARIGTLPANPEDWLAAAEVIGLEALQDDLAPDDLIRRLADTEPPNTAQPTQDNTIAHWWTEGSPFVPATRLTLSALPDAETFAAMLHAAPLHAVLGCQPTDQPEIPPGAGGVRE